MPVPNSKYDDETVLNYLREMVQNRKPTSDNSDTVLVTRVPCLGQLHFVRDRDGMMMMMGIILYWVYGLWSSYYVVIMPHYADGYVWDWAIYYHLAVTFLCLFSLLRASTLNPGRVPIVDEGVAKSRGWETCPHCARLRPDRAHHCRRCDQCVVRMDHHCPWINNCVGEANHHVFVLLLVYAFLFGFNTLVFLMLHFWYWPKCEDCDKDSLIIKHGIWFNYLSVVMAGFMVLAMIEQIQGQHVNITINRTTLETLKPGSTAKFNRPERRSFFKAYSDLFGTRIPLLWLLPWRRRKSSLMLDVIQA